MRRPQVIGGLLGLALCAVFLLGVNLPAAGADAIRMDAGETISFRSSAMFAITPARDVVFHRCGPRDYGRVLTVRDRHEGGSFGPWRVIIHRPECVRVEFADGGTP